MIPKKEEDKSFKISWKFVLVILSILIIIIFFAFYFGVIKKTCEDDICFNEALKDCSMTKYLKVHNLNYYKYSIDGSKGDNCKLNIDLVKMAVGTPQEKIDLFEGKGMKCEVPKLELAKLQSKDIESILSYCTGPLKEAMYEQIIEKLYTLIVSNMGEILFEIEDVLTS
ncbi:MAG: hypothetical protein KKA65_00200 [Nanoarchaeota archaeon]|nr:hypothetical protein [Nanoarchaeota archaeon]MBU4242214.1 hypothetical protein [Nanoarchaeota archaeon]MBU4352052.1 hypothetical protein [Nanoarchaeota archaeon]MBU4455907.1 hypothetical protein [Nanoarchaeota archaeon]MCG2720179.1 hypothetical protein [Nanoarchaeota archaeon]